MARSDQQATFWDTLLTHAGPAMAVKVATTRHSFRGKLIDLGAVVVQFHHQKETEIESIVGGMDFERMLDGGDLSGRLQNLLAVSAVAGGTAHHLLVQARMIFDDDSDLYVVLQALLTRKNLLQVQRTSLGAMMAGIDCEADAKPLKGGINCALQSKLFGEVLSQKASLLRATYRRFLENDSQPLEIYESWIASHGYGTRDAILDFVEEALGADMRSDYPSCNYGEFSVLLRQLQKIRLLRMADRQFMVTLLNQKLLGECKNEEALWLALLCGFVRGEQNPGELLWQILTFAGAALDHRRRISVLHSVSVAYKNLPDTLFAKTRNRGSVQASFDAVAGRLSALSVDNCSLFVSLY